jgi:hypothetical protein
MKAERFRATTARARHWISVFLLIAVFFLPLHFHAISAASQVAKECNCLHGSRTQAGLASAPSASIPLLTRGEVALVAQVDCDNHLPSLPSSRAPPPSASL